MCAESNRVKTTVHSGTSFTLGTVWLICTRILYPWVQLLCMFCPPVLHMESQHQHWWPSVLIQESPCAWRPAAFSWDFRVCPWNPSDEWVAAWAAQDKQHIGESYKVSTHHLSCDFIHEVSGEDCITMGFFFLSMVKVNKILKNHIWKYTAGFSCLFPVQKPLTEFWPAILKLAEVGAWPLRLTAQRDTGDTQETITRFLAM